MKKVNGLLSIAALSMFSASVMSGCSAAWQSAASANDGMYGVHDKIEIANRQRQAAELRRAEAEARKAELEARIADAEVLALENGYYDYTDGTMTYSSVLADTYESAYMRRLKGFNSPSYRMPSSYYNLRYGGAFNYVTAYDPAFYNVMVSGDQVWVEPKYISSMFGTWGATNVTFGVSFYPYSWYYGWNTPYYGSAWWGSPYYYSWYDWNWGFNHRPWGYGYGWYPGWNYGWGHVGAPRPPHYVNAPRPQRPNIVNRPSGGYGAPSSGGRPSGGSRGTVSGSGVYRPSGQGGGSQTSRPSNSGTPSRGSSGNGSYNNSNRSGSSSFFNGGSNSGGGSRSQGSSSYGGGSSSGGNRSGSSSSSGGGSRGNGIGR